ncbi:sporulation protein [Haladaptatus salinisoli]|uniref:sporulation protein n=1 Tax=Haladaptatus salinisoli TaxID=2884876 RepID=UPI001D0A2E4F|nr:sporulation protein [Haladaptatus salinisoli]
MKNVLSSIGVGSATVDTVFPTTTVVAGESIDATVEIEGGSSEQRVDGVYFALVTRYRQNEGSSNAVVSEFQLTDEFTVEAGAHRTIPVTVEIPPETPVTLGDTDVWVETGLDIDWALDPSDEDELRVEPGPHLAALHAALTDLGFERRSAETITAEYTPFDPPHGFVQQFEYRPVAGGYAGLDELELVCSPTDGLQVLAEVDRRGDPVTDWARSDERCSRFEIETTDENAIAETVDDVIERFV